MKSLTLAQLIITGSLACSAACWADPLSNKPAVMTKQDIAGEIFKRPSLIVEKRDNGSEALDVVSLLSSDKKFVTGMYQAPAGRFEINEAYGVDEYMHFLQGGVTLTSSDGSVTEIKAGDSVTIGKEWTGIWDTQGYTKIYVIYSADKPLE